MADADGGEADVRLAKEPVESIRHGGLAPKDLIAKGADGGATVRIAGQGADLPPRLGKRPNYKAT